MIEWIDTLEGKPLQGRLSLDESPIPGIKKVKSSDRLFFTENRQRALSCNLGTKTEPNPRTMSFNSHLAVKTEWSPILDERPRTASPVLLDVPSLDRSSGNSSKSGSQTSLNLIGSPWLAKIDRFHYPIDKVDFREKAEKSYTSHRSKSCFEIYPSTKPIAGEKALSLRIDAPSTVVKDNDFAVYCVVANKSRKFPATCTVLLRVDAGNKELRTMRKKINLDAGQDCEVSLMLSKTDTWTQLNGTEKQFTIISSAYSHDNEQILTKIQYVSIGTRHFRRPFLSK